MYLFLQHSAIKLFQFLALTCHSELIHRYTVRSPYTDEEDIVLSICLILNNCVYQTEMLFHSPKVFLDCLI